MFDAASTADGSSSSPAGAACATCSERLRPPAAAPSVGGARRFCACRWSLVLVLVLVVLVVLVVVLVVGLGFRRFCACRWSLRRKMSVRLAAPG